tara:strand:+ start:5160 stop:6029 length:870 start_codon:yes stop_codon:yes gene_type:complete
MTRALLLAVLLSISQITYSQTEKNSKVQTKTVEVEIENGEKQVTVTTKEKGKTTKEIYTGDDAEKWLEKHDQQRPAEGNKSKQTRVEVEIDTEDIEEIKKEIEEVRVEMNEQLERAAQKIDDFDVDSLLHSLGVEIEKSEDRYHYKINSDDGESKSIIIMKHKGDDGDLDIDVDVRIEENENESSEKITVKKRSYLIEDETSDNDVSFDEFEIYPNPAVEVLKIEFTTSKEEKLDIILTDIKGKIINEVTTRGKGHKNLVWDISDLKAGTYIIDMKQGNSHTTKKLIIQ